VVSGGAHCTGPDGRQSGGGHRGAGSRPAFDGRVVTRRSIVGRRNIVWRRNIVGRRNIVCAAVYVGAGCDCNGGHSSDGALQGWQAGIAPGPALVLLAL